MCSGVSQAVVSTTYDWIFLYTSKANWTYDIINTEFSKKLEACDIHSELSLQHGYYSYIITNSTEHAPLRRFFKAAVDALQLVFDRSLVTSVQPKSLLVQMREAVANCDDGSSDGSTDAAVATSRHSRGDISGRVFHGSGDAGRSFPRSHSSLSDTGKSPPTTSRGRPTRGLHTTTCEISTGGARPLHRELQSSVGT